MIVYLSFVYSCVVLLLYNRVGPGTFVCMYYIIIIYFGTKIKFIYRNNYVL